MCYAVPVIMGEKEFWTKKRDDKQIDVPHNFKAWVKVKKDWRDSDFLIKNFGYDKKEI